MQKNNAAARYAPLKAQFQLIEDAMPPYRFAAIEAVLYLLMLNAPDADPMKAYLLFSQYQLIGTTQCSAMEHILQRARYTLGYYRSKKYWQDDLHAYRRQRYDAVRAFSIQETEGKLSFLKSPEAYPYPYQEREKEWQMFWPENHIDTVPFRYAEAGTYKYVRPSSEKEEAETVSVKFDTECAAQDLSLLPAKGTRLPISIPIEELLDAALEMSGICPGDPCYSVLQTNILKQVSDESVRECVNLDICAVTNIVGMVGSGKSTLIKVLSYWCHRKGYQIAIVVDTVAEAMNLQKYLSSFGISCSPLIGRSERLKYINQVVQSDDMCLSGDFSKYLTPACLIDGMDEQHSTALTFGKEPCYSLRKNGRRHLCPHFDDCPGTKMLRECYHASVVITTVAGFAASRVGRTRETFLELAMRSFDLIIFDECDRVQKTLDHFFMPETRFNDFINESAEDCSAYMKLDSKRREENSAVQRYDELQRQSVTVLSCLIKSMHYNLGAWRKITYGDPFSALTLMDDLYQDNTEYKIPKVVYGSLYRLIDSEDEDSIKQTTLWAVLESSCKSVDESFFNHMYQVWLSELGTGFPRPVKDRARQVQDARIKLILRLIYFDHFIRDLSDAYEASHETAFGLNELFGFLQTRFRQQQYFLPSALCGNLFGMRKTDDEDIVLFRQFAFGRSLMKDLPYLRTMEDGSPAGPHTILLSGSSWAEGSYEYHVNRPVNYIIEADREKRRFLEKTRFFESGFSERVSGAGADHRMERLRIVAQKTVEWIMREYSRNAGKILVVVNSYSQAEEVQQILSAGFREAHCPASVCRMIPDAINGPNKAGTVRRGEVSRFASMDENILIAPAMAIERGHNIVDESGHSALCAVFFMVRPMAVPDDIQQKGSKLNGFVEAHCKWDAGESLFDYNVRIRKFAVQHWAKISKNKAFGLSDLEENERKDIVATLFVLILQIFGRLARVTDVTRPEPHVYFMDGAFRGREDKQDDFDCLSALGKYLESLMTQKESAEIANTLYAPFYEAYRKDIQYE